MRKKILTGLLILTAFALSACGSKDGTKAIKKSGILKVAVSKGGSGLLEKEGDAYSGLEAELAKSIADQFSLQIEYIEAATPEEALKCLNDHTADMAIGSIEDNASLHSSYGITSPYARGQLYMVTARGNFSNSVASVTGEATGVSPELSSQSQLALSTLDQEQLKHYTSREQGLEAVEAGSIQAYFCYEGEAKEIIGAEDTFQAQSVCDAEPVSYVIVTDEANEELLDGMETAARDYLDAANGQ